MRARIAAIVMAALLALYLVFVAQYALRLISSESGIDKALGIALAVLPIIGAWALLAELLFAFRAGILTRILAVEGNLPLDSLPKLASGRPDRLAADAEFPTYQAEVEASPESWRAWFRVGLAYDASGDRRRARWAVRQAIRLERTTR